MITKLQAEMRGTRFRSWEFWFVSAVGRISFKELSEWGLCEVFDEYYALQLRALVMGD